VNLRLLGDRRVSEIGLDCWRLRGGDWGDLTDEHALSSLHAAFDSGVTLFDTADVYGDGRSERLVGRFRKSIGADATGILISTKIGRTSQYGGAIELDAATLRIKVEGSVRRLGVESLDLLQLHCTPTHVMRSGEVFDALRGLEGAGMVRRWGASVETIEDALICLAEPGLASLNITFGVFRQKAIEAFFDEA